MIVYTDNWKYFEDEEFWDNAAKHKLYPSLVYKMIFVFSTVLCIVINGIIYNIF